MLKKIKLTKINLILDFKTEIRYLILLKNKINKKTKIK